MKKFNDITAAIICGGKSTRFGQNKAFVNINNKPLIELILEKLELIFDKIVINSNSSHFSKYKYPLIKDIYKNCDAMGGIYSILKNIDTQYAFVIACDMPFIEPDLIKYICSNKFNYDAVVPITYGKYQSLCAVYSKDIIPILEENIKSNKLKIIHSFDKIKVKLIKEKELKKFGNIHKLFFNINTENDLEKSLNNHFTETILFGVVAKHSNTGKTTLIKNILKKFKSENYKVGIIKNTFHDIEFDTPGKDSYIFYHEGADTVIINSENQLIIRKRTIQKTPLKLLRDEYLKEMDIIIIEGHKGGNYPRIEVIKTKQDDYLFNNDKNIIAVVGERKPDNLNDIPFFSKENIDTLYEFIKSFFDLK